MTQTLKTPKDIITALGGPARVREITGYSAGAVANWRQFDRFPAKTYMIMSAALHELGLEAPPDLWWQATPSKKKTSA